MGALHTEVPSPIAAFNCSIKVLRGDRFVGGLEEKARKYSAQLEMLYKRSTLGPALLSCSVDKFGDDTFTIHFRLTFNRKRLPRHNAPVEKTIRDIISTDAIARKPVFKHVRFVPGSIQVQEIAAPSDFSHTQAQQKTPSPTVKSGGVLLKTPIRKNTTLPVITPKKTSVAQGTFKISKTEADITEKHETTTSKAKAKESHTKPSVKRPSITSTVLKVASAVEKVNKTTTTEAAVTTTVPNTTPMTTTTTSTTTSTVKPSTTPPTSFLFNSNIFDGEPWIPIVPNLAASPIDEDRRPVYTSFTNPSLNFYNENMESLGSTKLRGHPLPVNKISEITEPINTEGQTENVRPHIIDTNLKEPEFIEVGLVPSKNDEDRIKNISAIFHNLASTLDMSGFNFSKVTEPPKEDDIEYNFGQGQAEVIDSVDELVKQTTKLPVTLLPAKSNSGIGKPLRKRPNRNKIATNQDDDTDEADDEEKRGFALPSFTSFEKTINNAPENFQIFGLLNFATETSDEAFRKAKMEKEKTNKEVVIYAINSSITNSRQLSHSLTPEKLKMLSQISKVQNSTDNNESRPKHISSSYAINASFQLPSKHLNKLPESEKVAHAPVNVTKCEDKSFICHDGTCLRKTMRCNHMNECPGGEDEQNCKCVDYLKSQLLTRKICDGVVDCWDFSDENECEWCKPSQYVCANSKKCIDHNKICDGTKDCELGDDEKQCVSIVENPDEANHVSYHDKGFVMVRRNGIWKKLCAENASSEAWDISDIGKAVCQTMTYEGLQNVNASVEPDLNDQQDYFKLSHTLRSENQTTLLFKETSCKKKELLKISCNSLECGIRPQNLRHRARIVGGGNAAAGAWPWQVALYKEGEFQCGGTLLNDRWLVSAGHCFYRSQTEYWVARLGALRRGTSLPSPYEQLQPIAQIIVHPGYEDNGFLNDIALLQMSGPVAFSDYIRPICLPSLVKAPMEDAECTVLGWGQLSEVGRIFPDTLQEVQVPLISTTECRRKTLFLPLYHITDEMFCAGFDRGGRDACLGDSGGPLLCPEDNGKWVLHGITSNGYGCARAGKPGVYTKVASYLEWINVYLNETKLPKNNTVSCLGYRCPLGQCLPKSQLCNGFMECGDGSDERGC